MGFVHLHTHSAYSLQDGLAKPAALAERARELGCPALALTDHGNIFGAVEFVNACKKVDVKPIVGTEAYFALDKSRRDQNDPRFHMLLLARTEEGYRNISRVLTDAYLNGFYGRARTDWKTLQLHTEGVIATSGCLASVIAQEFLAGREKEAEDWIKVFAQGFRDGFYLEIQANEIIDQRIYNKWLVDTAQKLGLPVVVTTDVHFLCRGDLALHEVYLNATRGKATDLKAGASEAHAAIYGSCYMQSVAEIEANLKAQGLKDSVIQEAIQNTLEVAEKVEFAFGSSRTIWPVLNLPKGETPEKRLAVLSRRGLMEKGKASDKTYVERLEYELEVISKQGFAPYFLVLHDVISWARKEGIPVGPGRGSAAGSLVAYCLGLTDVDPIRHGLLFERFLNPDRVSLPDIDTDFSRKRRDEVIEYVRRRFGEDRVASIGTFGTLGAKAAIRDVARALGIPLADVNQIAKLIPDKVHGEDGETVVKVTLEDALRESPGLQEWQRRYPDLFEKARQLEGLPRNASVHAAGVVIADKSIDEYVPLHVSKGRIATQYDMHGVEEIGLVKMDFLGLNTLDVIADTLEMIPGEQRPDFDDKSYLNDDLALAMLAQGETMGVFQLESEGMRRALQAVEPSRFEDIVAVLALYRPGPIEAGFIRMYADRKHGREPVEYIHPSVQDVLAETYGVIVYQEQVMFLAQRLAGYSMAEADALRKAMGKKKPEEMKAHRERFVKGCQEIAGLSKKAAVDLWNAIERFAGYAFNKSHATAYAYITMQTAYLKAHFPTEFYCALINSERGNTDKIAQYVADARRWGIDVLPPDVNISQALCTVEGPKQIRYGLALLKNVSIETAENIIRKRPYAGVADALERLTKGEADKKALLSLAGSRAFSFDKKAGTEYQDAYAVAEARKQRKRDEVNLGPMTRFNRKRIEKEAFGFYFYGHPLAHYTLDDVQVAEPGDVVKVGGEVLRVAERRTKRGHLMAFVDLLDTRGQKVTLIVWPQTYQKVRNGLAEGKLLVVQGKLDGGRVVCDHLRVIY